MRVSKTDVVSCMQGHVGGLNELSQWHGDERGRLVQERVRAL